jgi:hypothetical protein
LSCCDGGSCQIVNVHAQVASQLESTICELDELKVRPSLLGAYLECLKLTHFFSLVEQLVILFWSQRVPHFSSSHQELTPLVSVLHQIILVSSLLQRCPGVLVFLLVPSVLSSRKFIVSFFCSIDSVCGLCFSSLCRP